MHIFQAKIEEYTVEVTSVSLEDLSEDEIDHIWDRLEDDVTFGDLREDDSKPEKSWRLISA